MKILDLLQLQTSLVKFLLKVQNLTLSCFCHSEETQETLHHSITAWKSREKHYPKIGEGLYTLAVYEKLRRATIPLPSGNLLLVTIDNAGGQQQIMDKIINEVKIHDYTGTTG